MVFVFGTFGHVPALKFSKKQRVSTEKQAACEPAGARLGMFRSCKTKGVVPLALAGGVC